MAAAKAGDVVIEIDDRFQFATLRHPRGTP
jgi:hypothetical protein